MSELFLAINRLIVTGVVPRDLIPNLIQYRYYLRKNLFGAAQR